MHIHILGIAGTFMGGIAQLAKAKGFKVTGSDKAIYPPMSTQLAQADIEVMPYEQDGVLADAPDCVVVGNALSRGHAQVEATLNAQQVYTSGPQWLAANILHDRWVVAVAGTHGKTSTASMVAWILEYAGLNPGFLIGGVPENFGVSARLGSAPFFVVEADEYDTAFFDKRSKFVHYRPRTCVLNNLEFDHADIFDSLADIQKQFHHLIRTVPGNGLIVKPNDSAPLDEVVQKGCWTEIECQGLGSDWSFQLQQADGSGFDVYYHCDWVGQVQWGLVGMHNVRNALSAIAASVHCGVPPKIAVAGLSEFLGIKRRMTLVGEVAGIQVYDDFAHHPTAIQTTLQGAKKAIKLATQMAEAEVEVEAVESAQNNLKNATQTTRPGRLVAVFEPRSNTMRMGVHAAKLPKSFVDADGVYAFVDPAWAWQMPASEFDVPLVVAHSYDDLLQRLVQDLVAGDVVVIMSNGSFGGLHQKLLTALQARD